jgi:chaperonin GroES
VRSTPRKSTDHNLDLEFNSLDAQREACEAYIKSQAHEDWRLARGRYDDGAFSGASLDRPAQQELLTEVSAGRVDIIVVYKVDRILSGSSSSPAFSRGTGLRPRPSGCPARRGGNRDGSLWRRMNWHSRLRSAKRIPFKDDVGDRAMRDEPPLFEISHHKQLFRRIDMKFRPLHDRIVVTRIDADARTPGGIIIPDTAKEKPSEGEVISVGPGGRDEAGKIIPIDLRVGDRVLFGKWSGTEVKIDGVEYLIMKESDVMGVIEQTVASKKAA